MRWARVLTEGGQEAHAFFERDGWQPVAGAPWAEWSAAGRPIRNPVLLAPLMPPAIVGIGQNYGLHAREMGGKPPERPVVFFKNPSSVLGPESPIELPRGLPSEKVDWEAELAVIVGRACKNVSPEHAWPYIWGFTCANDVSARDWQKEWGGGQWCRGKSFDTFCPLGPWIVTADELGDPHRLAIESRIGGEVMQRGSTSDLVFSIPELVSFLSGSTTLVPGTTILTGTPAGVGAARTPLRFLRPGDFVEIEIEGIGVLSNSVVAEAAEPIAWRSAGRAGDG